MAAIIYTALREIEKTGYLKSGTTFSAAASDDSINDSASGLSGLLIDQWLLAAGFATAVNNTWFQAKANATTATILTLTPPMSHLRLPGVAGNYASTPDTAANSITGDIDLRGKIAPVDWTPAAVDNTVIAKWTGSPQSSYILRLAVTGTLMLLWSNDGTALLSAASTVIVSAVDGALKWVRATLDVDNGAAGRDIKFYTSDDGVAWTQLGATVTQAGVTSIFNSTAVLEIGSIDVGASQWLIGKVYYAEVRNGIGGPVVAAFDPTRATRGATSFVALTGETWTITAAGTPPAMLQGPFLTTEAAGAAVVLTGHKRGLGQSYNLEFKAEVADLGFNVDSTSHWPQDRSPPETIVYGRDEIVNVTTDIISDAAIKQWREFRASVEGTELFTFDRYGTIASPNEPRQAMLLTKEWKERRIFATMQYQLSFDVQLF